MTATLQLLPHVSNFHEQNSQYSNNDTLGHPCKALLIKAHHLGIHTTYKQQGVKRFLVQTLFTVVNTAGKIEESTGIIKNYDIRW